jgi:hypothetical protein
MTNALSLQDHVSDTGKELAQAGASAKERAEIESAIIIAKRFPRNESEAFQELMKACSRPSFAEDATYSFPRGDKEVSGPSVNLAREAGRIFGNIRFGLYIVRDDDESVLIRGWAWDIQRNTRVEHEDNFKKLIQRKVKGGKPGETVWLIPDERDLRELINRRGAILVRNALLQIMPKDLIEDALYQCSKTLEGAAGQDPEGERKRLLVDFMALHVTVEMLEKKLGHPFAQSSAKELAELRGMCKSIQDGHTSWSEYAKEPEEKPASNPDKDKLKEAQEKLKQQTQPTEKPKETKPKEELTMAQARLILADTVLAAEIGTVVNWSLHAELTPVERKEIMDLKEQAVERMRGKGKKGK